MTEQKKRTIKTQLKIKYLVEQIRVQEQSQADISRCPIQKPGIKTHKNTHDSQMSVEKSLRIKKK